MQNRSVFLHLLLYIPNWGYTGEDGEILIDFAFEEALDFNEDGSAPVKRGEAWELIKLGIYK